MTLRGSRPFPGQAGPARPAATHPWPPPPPRLGEQVELGRPAKLARTGAKQASGVSFPAAVRQEEEGEGERPWEARAGGVLQTRNLKHTVSVYTQARARQGLLPQGHRSPGRCKPPAVGPAATNRGARAAFSAPHLDLQPLAGSELPSSSWVWPPSDRRAPAFRQADNSIRLA